MITRIGNTPIQKKHKASCHCGAVVLELTLPDGVVDPAPLRLLLLSAAWGHRRLGAAVRHPHPAGRRRFAATSSTPAPRNTTSAASAASTPITSADPIRRNMATTSPVWRVNPFDLGEVPTRDGCITGRYRNRIEREVTAPTGGGRTGEALSCHSRDDASGVICWCSPAMAVLTLPCPSPGGPRPSLFISSLPTGAHP